MDLDHIEVGAAQDVADEPFRPTVMLLVDGLIGFPMLCAFATLCFGLFSALVTSNLVTAGELFGASAIAALLGALLGSIMVSSIWVASRVRPKFERREAQNRDLIWVEIAVVSVVVVNVFESDFQILRDPIGLLVAIGLPPLVLVWMKFIRRFEYLEQVSS